MNNKTHVAILTILAMLTWPAASALAQADKDAKTTDASKQTDTTKKNVEVDGEPDDNTNPSIDSTKNGPPSGDDNNNNNGNTNQTESTWLGKFFPFIMIGGFLVLWMFMGRSRKKREAERKAMLDNLSKGDRVVTIGGIVGTIVETRETEIVVKVDDNTRMKFARWAVRNAGEAANEDKKKDTQEQQ